MLCLYHLHIAPAAAAKEALIQKVNEPRISSQHSLEETPKQALRNEHPCP